MGTEYRARAGEGDSIRTKPGPGWFQIGVTHTNRPHSAHIMKATTKDWFQIADDHLLAAQKLSGEAKLTPFVVFHCQQCIEKALKGIMEEQDHQPAEGHDLLKLFNETHIQLLEEEAEMLGKINEASVEQYNPEDLGLMPNRKPALNDTRKIMKFTEDMFIQLKEQLKTGTL